MNYNDQIFIIKNRLFEKRNIIFILILTIIFLILYTSLTIICVSIDNKNAILNSSDARTYKIYHEYKDINHTIKNIPFTEEQIDSIKNINHIETIYNSKYLFATPFYVSEFNKNGVEGNIHIKALVKNDDIKIKKGNNIKNNYELVCSNNFYPHEIDEKIYKQLYLSSRNIINKEITIKSENEEILGKEFKLKIVGTYNNRYEEEANTCYTNITTFDELVSKYSGVTKAYDINGNLNFEEKNEYLDYLIRIDSKNNINSVLETLKSLNFEFGPITYLDPGFLDLLFFIPLFASVIIIFLVILILYNFISKKIFNKLNKIGIMEALGFDKKSLVMLSVNENIITIIISGIISLIIYLIILNYLRYSLLSELTYGNYILNVPYLLIILSIIIFGIISCLFVQRNYKKINKQTIQELLKK